MKKKLKILATGVLGSAGLIFGTRFVTNNLTNWIGKILMTDEYGENLLELYSAGKKVGIQNVAELNLRAETGKVIKRPLGSPRQTINFDGLMFTPAQLNRLPEGINQPVDTRTVIGKKCKRPLVLDTPILISAMAYGFALSEQAKYAMAKASSLAGTAANTGVGPLLQKERDLADRLVIQYHRGNWTKDPNELRQADMIEIQIGQGAILGMGLTVPPNQIDETLRQRLELHPGEPAIIKSRLPELEQPNGLRKLVIGLRELSDGVPIGCKVAMGNDLEAELDVMLDAGVDVIVLDGSQAGTMGSPPLFQDDFGLPTLIGLVRAIDHLEKSGLRNQIDLIVSGGLYTPGHFLKVLALGADAVYIGTATLLAVSHTQVLKPIPFEPPTQLIWQDAKYAHKFNWKKGAKTLANFINSCTDEMKEGVKALGKTKLSQVTKADLISLDKVTTAITGIPLAYPDKTDHRINRTRQRVRRTP